MYRITFLLIAVWVALGVAGCGDQNRKSEILEKANQTHLEALAISERVEERLDSVRKTSGNPASIQVADSLANLVEQWEEGMVEVPGFEHAHHDKHGHGEHEHKTAPNMTDESMLEFQITAKEAIILIEREVDKQF